MAGAWFGLEPCASAVQSDIIGWGEIDTSACRVRQAGRVPRERAGQASRPDTPEVVRVPKSYAAVVLFAVLNWPISPPGPAQIVATQIKSRDVV